MKNIALINLNVIKRNALNIKKRLPKNTKFCAVVKADAYGHGAERVASAIYGIVDCFAVALVEEGEKLRLCGIKKDILILTPVFKEEIDRAILNNFTLTVDRVEDLKKIIKCAKKLNAKVKVHFKYNTGMNRLGFDSLNELNQALSVAKKSGVIIIDGLYCHYSKPQNDKSLNKATNKFLLANKLIKGYNESAVCHASASGGFLKEKYFDMVRIGILLYGYYPFKSQLVLVKPAMKVYSYVVKQRKIGFFSNALYGNKKTILPKNLSIIRFGYADGLLRKRVSGQFNNRCMDLTAVIDKKARVSGGKVLVMENADKLAKKYKTIPYEILTKIAIRAEKIYKN